MAKQVLPTTDDWRVWQLESASEPHELWTRAEILETAKRLGVRRPDGNEVDDRTLRFWEESGVIPRGIEEKIPGRGYTYRMYPWWVVDLLHQACQYQRKHVKLRDLPPRMRVEARYLSMLYLWGRPKDPRAYADNSLGSYILRQLREPTLPPFSRQIDAGVDDAERQVADALRKLNFSQQWSGLNQAVQARVQFLNESGEPLATYEVDLREYRLTPEQQASFDRLRAEMEKVTLTLTESSTSE